MDGVTTVALTALRSNDSEISSEELSEVGLDLAGQTSSRRRRWPVRHIFIGLAALIVLAGASFYGHYYWATGQYLVSTDDATVDAHSVVISPKISGYIADVAVEDNETVHAGQILARIDDRDYRTAVAAAQANVASAQAGIRHMEQQIDQQQLTVVATRAAVTTDQAALVFSRQQ
jgi:membrane fusion protein (multidrug efflux system)